MEPDDLLSATRENILARQNIFCSLIITIKDYQRPEKIIYNKIYFLPLSSVLVKPKQRKVSAERTAKKFYWYQKFAMRNYSHFQCTQKISKVY